jgi:protein required for attachment to host cells
MFADYSAAVRKAIQRELHKDLVKMPVHEIEKQLLARGSGNTGSP